MHGATIKIELCLTYVFCCYLPRITAIPNHLNYCETVIDVHNLQMCPRNAWYSLAGRGLQTHGLYG